MALNTISLTLTIKRSKETNEEKFEDTKGVTRNRISKKNRQHNGQKRKYKRTNRDVAEA